MNISMEYETPAIENSPMEEDEEDDDDEEVKLTWRIEIIFIYHLLVSFFVSVRQWRRRNRF